MTMNNSLKRERFLRRVAVLLLTAVVVLLCLGGAHVLHLRSEARQVFREARNLEISLRLMGIEAYGENRRVYNSLSPDGMAEGIWEEAKELSGAEGTMVLGSWDGALKRAKTFIYRKGRFLVLYEYDRDTGEANWDFYYEWRREEP